MSREIVPRAADDDVGMDTDAPQLVDRVLRGLRLQFACGIDEGDQRDVQIEHVLGAELVAELPDRLEERQGLDVADGPPTSEMTTSASLVAATRRILSLISFVT